MHEWEERAKDLIREARARVGEAKDDYPLGWEENAVFNLQQEMKESGLFVEDRFEYARIHMAEQIIKNVKGTI
jgi:HEPN domain-containing protein